MCSTGLTLEGLNGASATSGWLTSRSSLGPLKPPFPNCSGVFEEGSRRVPCIKWSSNLTAQVAIFERILLDAVTVPKDLL